ncbi:cytochrome P450 736A117-like [Coffea arabica]|uniref:Cytochrome P450 736A117-like n=1 Tax=Coffea arabica TaxID=13443 RepID=A0A6P6X2K7_COFAR
MASSSGLVSELKFDVYMFHPIFFSLFPLILLWFLFKLVSNSRKNQPPSPPGLPIIGNLHQLSSLPHYPLHSLAQKYGPIMFLKFGSVPTVVVSSADGASLIMKTHDLIFSDRPFSSTANKLLYNMKDISVAPYGEYWRQLKSICVLQLLSNKKVQAFRNIREEETSIMMQKIKDASLDSTPVNLSEMFVSLTNDIVCRSAFGRKYGGGETGKKFKLLLGEFLELLNGGSLVKSVPCLSWINRVNGYDARVDRVAREVDEFLEGVVQERLDGAVEKYSCGSGGETIDGESREDFLDILLKIYKDNATGVTMDRDSVKAIILDVFSAGTDTTATVAEWAMAEILRHPIVLKKLQTEIRGVVGGKEQISEDDLAEMHYLKAVIKETLRLHPPIPLLVPREAREDVKIMGYDIAAGTMVIINAWGIGRDPAYWDEPVNFMPERFMDSSIDFKGHDFQLIPFGAGRRGCPGIAFAVASNELVLANLVGKFDWQFPDGAQGKELDMTECPGVAVRRKIPLLVIPSPLS